MAPMTYEGSDDDEEHELVPLMNQNNNNNYNIARNVESKSVNGKNLFNKNVNEEVEATHKTTVNAKVVQTIEKLYAL